MHDPFVIKGNILSFVGSHITSAKINYLKSHLTSHFWEKKILNTMNYNQVILSSERGIIKWNPHSPGTKEVLHRHYKLNLCNRINRCWFLDSVFFFPLKENPCFLVKLQVSCRTYLQINQELEWNGISWRGLSQQLEQTCERVLSINHLSRISFYCVGRSFAFVTRELKDLSNHMRLLILYSFLWSYLSKMSISQTIIFSQKIIKMSVLVQHWSKCVL